MKAQIVFASMTGNDEDMAEILEENLQDAGFDVENIDVSFADASSYYCENVDDFEKAFIKCGAIEAAKPVKIENAVDDEDIALIDQATEEIVEAFNG